MSHLLPDPLDNSLSLHTVLADLAGVLSEQLQTRSLMTQTLRLVGETTAGDPVEHKLALQQPLWSKKPLQAAFARFNEFRAFSRPSRPSQRHSD